MQSGPDHLAAFANLLDLANDAVGGQALLASDDFFAEKENLVKAAPAVFDPDAYTDRGKEMDGWESRRQRIPGHDWCIVKLGIPGRIRGVDIDTSHFTGNQPPYGAVYGICAAADADPRVLRDRTDWIQLTPQVPLRPGSHNLFATVDGTVVTHVRLDIYPDGGVARLRCYGEPVPDEAADTRIDLAASVHGGRAIAASDQFYSPPDNLLAPGLPKNMGGGWETRRRRTAGNDWVLVELGQAGLIDALVVDTTHFKGNFPDRARVRGVYWPGAPVTALLGSEHWEDVLPESKLRAHESHVFPQLSSRGPFTHLLLDILPCGGIARFRAMGHPAQPEPRDALLDAVNGPEAEAAFRRCCGSNAWVEGMLAAGPYRSRAQLFGTAEHVWWHLGEGHWREAFTHHPRIGADVDKLREKFAATADLSAAEQGDAVASASEEVLQALAAGNRAYEERFGYLFIVKASGKSAAEMLALLEQRLDNPPAAEIRIAAGEQAKITRHRLLTAD